MLLVCLQCVVQLAGEARGEEKIGWVGSIGGGWGELGAKRPGSEVDGRAGCVWYPLKKLGRRAR